MSLSLTYNELQKAIGRYLGYGRNVYGSDDGSSQWSDIEDCITSGLRQFYTPPVLPNQQISHAWSFLKPCGVMSLTAGVDDYDMCGDFGGLAGSLTFEPSVGLKAVVVVGESAIRMFRQNRPQTGNPTHAAIRPKSTLGNSTQVFEMVFWPTPETDVQLSYRYYVLAQKLTNDNPYPYGNSVHSETILQSCLSIAEQRLNDSKGVHWEKFLERLSASIQIDNKTSGPDFFGYNADNSDHGGLLNARFDAVTVNGFTID